MMIGQTVQCRVIHQFVEVYFDHQMIAKHPKALCKGDYKRNADHAPPFKEAVLNCSREGLLINAQEIGDEVYKFCEKILSECYVDKLRPVRKILSLALSYEAGRLNKACKRALHYKTFSYRSIKDILEKGLDLEPVQPSPAAEKTNFRFARDPQQYKRENQIPHQF
jgi:arginine/lysine/ornithine decarboxylase